MFICIIGSENTKCDATPEFMGDVVEWSPRILGLNALSMVYDPYFLAGFDEPVTAVEIRDRTEMKLLQEADLIVVPHQVPEEIEMCLCKLIASGKKVFWVRPSPKALEAVPAVSGEVVFKGKLLSAKESWFLEGQEFYYPQSLWYDRYEVRKDALVKRGIGELPDLIHDHNFAFCSADFFHAYEWYRVSPRHVLAKDGFTNHFSLAYINILMRLLGMEYGDICGEAYANLELRRDFHSYGFARKMVSDLAGLLDRTVDFSLCDKSVLEAAKALVGEKDSEKTMRLLKGAFVKLAQIRQALVSMPVYYVDSLHGGIMYEQCGFVEFDYPEYVKDLYNMYLRLVDTRDYKFCVDIGVSSYDNLAIRYPHFIKKLAGYWAEGKIELVNGTYGQPYPQVFPLESNIRHFETGQRVMKELFGRRVTAFASQEFALAPQYPGILSGFEYEGACHRVQNSGSTVWEHDEFVLWSGPDGKTIKAVPSHVDKSETRIGRFFHDWPQQILLTLRHGYSCGIYTNLLDQVWTTPFREEVIRSSYYAPILGEMLTYHELFKRSSDMPVREYARDDYECSVYFSYPWVAGTSKVLQLSGEYNNRLESIEKLLAFSGKGSETTDTALFKAWKELCAYQNHDNFCIPAVTAGGCTLYFPGEGGPSRMRNEQIEEYGLTILKNAALRCDEEFTKALGQGTGEEITLFNPLNIDRSFWVTQDKQAGIGTLKNIKAIYGSLIKKVDVPSFGTAEFAPAADERVVINESKDPVIENDILKITLDVKSGAISSILDKRNGKELVNGKANYLAFGNNGTMDCTRYRKVSNSGIRQLVVDGCVYDKIGNAFALYTIYITLAPNSKRIYFNTCFQPFLSKEAGPTDQWEDSIKAVFDFNLKSPQIMDCWMNMRNIQKRERFSSLYGVTVSDGPDSGVLFLHNTGNQHYTSCGAVVANILYFDREQRLDYQYALELVDTDAGVFRQALDYQYDPLILKGYAPESNWLKLDIDNSGIWISAVNREGDTLHIRLVETLGRNVTANLRTETGIKSACTENYYRERKEDLLVRSGKIRLTLPKYSVTNIGIELEKTN